MNPRLNKLSATIALAALSVTIVSTIIFYPDTRVATIHPRAATPTTSRTTANTANTPTSMMYKNGTYNATGSYYSPGGKETLKVSLTLNENVVTGATVQSGGGDPTAISYQSIFISGYKPYVIGKKIGSIKLKNVSGSSLTPQGFNDALKQIEHEATA